MFDPDSFDTQSLDSNSLDFGVIAAVALSVREFILKITRVMEFTRD